MIFIKIKDKHIRIFAILLIYSNGQLIFTDPTNPDSDGDGLLDGEEIVVTYGQKYIHGAGNNGSSISAVYFNYKSNPKGEDSNGDGLNDIKDVQPLVKFDNRFILVDNINYHPSIDFMDYDKLGTGDTEFNPMYGTVGKDGRDYCYNSKLPTAEDLLNYSLLLSASAGAEVPIISEIFGKSCFDSWTKMTHSGDFLKWFLDNTGSKYVLSEDEFKEIISTSKNNLYHYMINVNSILDLAEKTLVDGETLTFSSNTNDNFKVCCYTQKHCDENHIFEEKVVLNTDVALDWSYSIGEAFGGMVFEITKQGNTYIATYKYCLMDYYEWGYHIDGGDMMQHMLHECGLAQEYPIFGILTSTIEWNKGERISTIEEIKDVIYKQT